MQDKITHNSRKISRLCVIRLCALQGQERSALRRGVTVVRMEVPCCGGITEAVKKALMASGKFIPWSVITVSTDGRVLE